MTAAGLIALVIVVAMAWCSHLDVAERKASRRRWRP